MTDFMERNKFISYQWFQKFVLLVCIKLFILSFESNLEVDDNK